MAKHPASKHRPSIALIAFMALGITACEQPDPCIEDPRPKRTSRASEMVIVKSGPNDDRELISVAVCKRQYCECPQSKWHREFNGTTPIGFRQNAGNYRFIIKSREREREVEFYSTIVRGKGVHRIQLTDYGWREQGSYTVFSTLHYVLYSLFIYPFELLFGSKNDAGTKPIQLYSDVLLRVVDGSAFSGERVKVFLCTTEVCPEDHRKYSRVISGALPLAFWTKPGPVSMAVEAGARGENVALNFKLGPQKIVHYLDLSEFGWSPAEPAADQVVKPTEYGIWANIVPEVRALQRDAGAGTGPDKAEALGVEDGRLAAGRTNPPEDRTERPSPTQEQARNTADRTDHDTQRPDTVGETQITGLPASPDAAKETDVPRQDRRRTAAAQETDLHGDRENEPATREQSSIEPEARIRWSPDEPDGDRTEQALGTEDGRLTAGRTNPPDDPTGRRPLGQELARNTADRTDHDAQRSDITEETRTTTGRIRSGLSGRPGSGVSPQALGDIDRPQDQERRSTENTTPEGRRYRVIANGVNVRGAPGLASTKSGMKLFSGDLLLVLEELPGTIDGFNWAKVRINGEGPFYVAREFLTPAAR